jgi:hypothetical protein
MEANKVPWTRKHPLLTGHNHCEPYIQTRFVCFEPHEKFFSYLAAVTIAGDRATKLLTAFSIEGSFTCRKTRDSHF